MLEQAALCFVKAKLVRKFALHMILAGHRFGKSNLKAHALRCYEGAYQLFTNRGWRMAEVILCSMLLEQFCSILQLELWNSLFFLVNFKQLLSSFCCFPSCFRLNEGLFYFGPIKGFLAFHSFPPPFPRSMFWRTKLKPKILF